MSALLELERKQGRYILNFTELSCVRISENFTLLPSLLRRFCAVLSFEIQRALRMRRACWLWTTVALLATATLSATTVPFFVYEGPAYDFLRNCSVNGTEALQQHRRYKHGDDVLFVERALQHPWRTRNASEAVLFVVPVLLTFAIRHNGICGRTASQMQDITAAALHESPHFQASGGADHLIVASSFQQHQPKTYTRAFKGVLKRMVFGSFEVFPTHIGAHLAEDWADRLWRCTVVTPYVDKHKPMNVSSLEPLKQFRQRKFSVFFMGQVTMKGAYGLRRKVGDVVIASKKMNAIYSSSAKWGSAYTAHCTAGCAAKGRCVGCTMPKTQWQNYEEYLADSQFSLMISGDTPSSSRLYDAISSGVIPILVSA
jgi:Exostosin family